MGWLIYPDTPSDIKAEITRILTGPQTTPIKICRVGSTWYARNPSDVFNTNKIKRVA